MIHGDRENERVESLIVVMANMLRMLDTSTEPCDPELAALLHASYRTQTEALRREQASFERRKARTRARSTDLYALQPPDNKIKAIRQIQMIEDTLAEVRARVTEIERQVPLNHARLQSVRAELDLHEMLLVEWQEFEEELLAPEP